MHLSANWELPGDRSMLHSTLDPQSAAHSSEYKRCSINICWIELSCKLALARVHERNHTWVKPYQANTKLRKSSWSRQSSFVDTDQHGTFEKSWASWRVSDLVTSKCVFLTQTMGEEVADSLLACGGLALCFVSRKKQRRAAASPQGGTFGVWAHVSSRQPWIWRSCLEAFIMNSMSVSGCQQWWEAREVAEGSDHLGLPVLNTKG